MYNITFMVVLNVKIRNFTKRAKNGHFYLLQQMWWC